jgi:acetyl-CoA synthetase
VSDDRFREARDLLLDCRADYHRAVETFRWPRPDAFNWALDWFDRVPPRDRIALHVVGADGRESRHTFGQLSSASDRVASGLRAAGIARSDHLLVMLGNVPELWIVMLAAMKLGAVVIPTSTLLTAQDLGDRIERGAVRGIVCEAALCERFADLQFGGIRVAVGDAPAGWRAYAEVSAGGLFRPDGITPAADPLLLYFTSGTTRLPKLVEHTHASYPIGHLSTMYWLGIQPGDVHLNVSSPGWAKHAWSCVFAPWNAEATAFVFDAPRFDPAALLEALVAHRVTSMCAPPTVWRLLIQHDLERYRVHLRELASAGEPLNPEVIDRVRDAWGRTIRDGYGQTETTLQVGNFVGQAVRAGSMGRPAPGYGIVLVDPDGSVVDGSGEGELGIDLAERPVGLMAGYRDDAERTAEAMRDGIYHTGDVARRDADGYLTFVGRTDDIFKASDYRISPFELESALIEHPAVAEAAVVPSPDPERLAVPKAYVVLAPGHAADEATARSILAFARERLAPYKRVRRIEFADLPKTISGKIRRVELRRQEQERAAPGGSADGRHPNEWWEEDLGLGSRARR